MKTIDLRKLQAAHKILATMIDRLVELEDIEADLEWEPLPKVVEIDGLTPRQEYCRDCGCCEGMDW